MGSLSDGQTLVAAASPVSLGSGTTRVGWIDMSAYHRVQFIVNVGTTGTGASIIGSVRQATDTNGTGDKVLSTAKSVASITASNGYSVVNVGGSDLDVNNSFRYVSLLMTVTGTTGITPGVIALGNPEVTPPSSVLSQTIVG